MGTTLGEELEALVESGPGALETFAASLDSQWIADALAETGSASIRRLKLPAEQAVWLVLGMGLFADRSIEEVVEHLDLVVPGVTKLARSAVPKARYRLGAKPLRYLFEKTAESWAAPAREEGYRGLALLGVDGTCMRVADSDENFAHFGKPGGRGGSNDAGYPQGRLACLLNLGSWMLVDARLGPYATSEQELATELWPKVPAQSLTILDRGFINYRVFHELVGRGGQRHLMVRMRENMKVEEKEQLADGTVLALLHPCRVVEQDHPDLKGTSIKGRVVAYRHEGGKPCRLFTTLVDSNIYPAAELIRLYHDRWEIELAFDEIKTHMLERKESLRSKKPTGVEQEIWGLLTLYNLVRREMAEAAREHGLPPNRASFRIALLWLRTFWALAWRTRSPGRLPASLKELRSRFNVFLPPRRTKRRYPRHVKINMRNFARNRGKRAIGSATPATA